MVAAKYALMDGAVVRAVVLYDPASSYNPAPYTLVPYNPAIHVLAQSVTDVNAADLRTKMQAALDANTAFLAVANPTNAQTLAQVQRLTRETTALLRLALNALDSTDGT